MTNVTQAPAAPAQGAAPAVPDVADSRLSAVTEPSRPAGSANITGAELSAKIASSRRARRSGSVAGQSNHPGNPAKQESASQPPAPTTGFGGAADPESEHATSPPAGEAALIDGLVKGDVAQGGEHKETETPSPAPEAEAAVEPGLEDLLDDPETATEEQIKAVKDRSIRKLLSRVHKLTARLKEAQAAKPASGSEPQPVQALGSDPQVARLEQNLGLLREAAQWARKNPDGGEFKNSKGQVIGVYTAEQVDGILTHAPEQIATLAGELTARQETLRRDRHQVTQSAMEQARQAYAWMAKPDSDEYGEALAVVQQAPYIQQHPEWPVWVADAIAGRRARLAQAEASAKPKVAARPVPPKVPPPSSSAAPRVDPAAKALAEAEAAYSKSGKQSDLQVVLRLRRQARPR